MWTSPSVASQMAADASLPLSASKTAGEPAISIVAELAPRGVGTGRVVCKLPSSWSSWVKSGGIPGCESRNFSNWLVVAPDEETTGLAIVKIPRG